MEERILKMILNGKFHNIRSVGKPIIRRKDVDERDALQILEIRGWRRRPGGQKMEAPFVGGQRPEGAVAPRIDKMEGWLDGSKCKLFANNFNKNQQFWAEPNLLSIQPSLND